MMNKRIALTDKVSFGLEEEKRAAEALRKDGYDVKFCSPPSPLDLIAEKNGRVYGINVKSNVTSDKWVIAARNLCRLIGGLMTRRNEKFIPALMFLNGKSYLLFRLETLGLCTRGKGFV